MALRSMAICCFAWFAAVKRFSREVAATGMLLAPCSLGARLCWASRSAWMTSRVRSVAPRAPPIEPG